jgi:hypothetical protein
MFIDNLSPPSDRRLTHVLETLRLTYGFDLSNASPQDLVALGRQYDQIRAQIVSESGYNSYHTNPEYTKAMLISEAVRLLTEIAPRRRTKSSPHTTTNEADMNESKKAKPDFLDVDKDGNTKETFKKALRDKARMEKDKKDVKESLDRWYGRRVEIKPQGGMKEFWGKTGTVVGKEMKMLRVKLDEPVHIPGVGMVKDDLWEPGLLKTIRMESAQHPAALQEKWDTKMKTAAKDVGKWDGWSIAKLKARKKKLMDKEKRSAPEVKEVRQINFALRAKQKDHWGKIKESVLMEDEALDKAETLLAAKDISDRLQDMAEDAAKMAVDQLMPLVNTMKDKFGLDAANGFNEVVKAQLQTVLDTIVAAKDQTDNAINQMESGQAPTGTSDIGAASPAPTQPGAAMPPAAPEDEFAAGPTTAGPQQEPLGRSKKDELAEASDDQDIEKAKADYFKRGGTITKGPTKAARGSEYWRRSMRGGHVGRTGSASADAPGLRETSPQKCMECGAGWYQESADGKMKCNECGHVMLEDDASSASSTPAEQLALMAQSGKTPDNKMLNPQQKAAAAQAAQELEKANLQEKAPPGFDYDLEKKLLKQYKGSPEKAYATMWKIHKQQKGKKQESQLERAQHMLEGLQAKLQQHKNSYQMHRQAFAVQLQEGLQMDPLGVGHGLEGDAILAKVRHTLKQISEVKSLKARAEKHICEAFDQLIQAQSKVSTLEQQLNTEPYGIIAITNNNTKVRKFFENTDYRQIWLDFNKDTLKEYKLINPDQINKAKQFITKKI